MPAPTTHHDIELWVDPSCPWAWQSATWFRELRDLGAVRISWKLFSLELNASEPGKGFWSACERYGEALVALALARREGGDAAFESLYVAIGKRLHEDKEAISPQVVHKAAADAGQGDVPERALADPSSVDDVLSDHHAARARSVFGVPTFTVDGSKAMYGPILPLAPRGQDAATWWEHVRWLAEQPDFFELKRWPRELRPGQGPSQT